MKAFDIILIWLLGIAINLGLLALAVWVVILILRATGVIN